MTPITLTDEEREALKQNIMKRYAAADTIEPEAQRRGNIADWGDALTQFATAGSRGNLGLKADTAYFDKQRESADHDIAMARQDRAQALSDAKNLIGLGYGEEEMAQKRKEWERQPGQWERQDRASDFQLGKMADEDTLRKETMDPNSVSSFVRQKLAGQVSENQFLDQNGKPKYPPIDFRGVSGAHLGDINDLLKHGGGGNLSNDYFKMANLELARQGRDLQAASFDAARAQEQYNHRREEQERDDKLRKESEEKVAKYQLQTEPLKSQLDAIAEVERKLGFQLEKYDPKTETVGGKKYDAPGVNIPVLGRVTAYSSEARVLQSSIDAIINKEIKNSAGTAVSSAEMERIKRQWAAGAYNSEAEMLGALRSYKAATQRELQRSEAAYNPKVRQQYRENLEQTPGPIKPNTTGSGGAVIHERTNKLP